MEINNINTKANEVLLKMLENQTSLINHQTQFIVQQSHLISMMLIQKQSTMPLLPGVPSAQQNMAIGNLQSPITVPALENGCPALMVPPGFNVNGIAQENQHLLMEPLTPRASSNSTVANSQQASMIRQETFNSLQYGAGDMQPEQAPPSRRVFSTNLSEDDELSSIVCRDSDTEMARNSRSATDIVSDYSPSTIRPDSRASDFSSMSRMSSVISQSSVSGRGNKHCDICRKKFSTARVLTIHKRKCTKKTRKN